MSRTKGLFMALLLAISLGFIFRFEVPRSSRTAFEEAMPERVFAGVSPESVKKLSVVSKQGSFAVERQGNTWALVKPPHALADNVVVPKLLTATLGSTIQNALSGDERDSDLSVYGLNPPEGVVTVEGAFGKRVLSFGKKIAITGRRYAQPEGDPRIYVVEDDVATKLLVTPQSIRESMPFQFDPGDVEQVILQRPDAELDILTRKGPLEWEVEEGDMHFPGDAELITVRLRELGRAKVKNYLDELPENLALYGLKSPRLIVRVRVREGAPMPKAAQQRELIPAGERVTSEAPNEFSLQLGEAVFNSVEVTAPNESVALPKHFYARISGVPTVYGFDRPFYTDFLQPAEHFRPRHPFQGLSADQLTRLALTADGATVQLVRSGKEWRVDGTPAGKGSPTTRVDSWIHELSQLDVLDYTSIGAAARPEAGVQNAVFHAELTMTDGSVRRLRIGGQLTQNADSQEHASPAKAPPDDAPRWMTVTMSDGVALSAVADAVAAKRLLIKPTDLGVSPSEPAAATGPAPSPAPASPHPATSSPVPGNNG